MSPDETGRGRFAVAVSCIDGRAHAALTEWVRTRYGVDWVDLVTEPGPDAVLASCERGDCTAVRRRLEVSLRAHAPEVVVVAGHDDCAANPVPASEHRSQLLRSVEEVRRWAPSQPVVGVWIDANSNVETIDPAPASVV